MADSDILGLPPLTEAADSDAVPIVDVSAGETKYIEVSDLFGTVSTFTPTLIGATTAGTYTYNTQLGYYVQIGKICHVTIRIDVSGETVGPSGQIRISGLPFNVAGSRICPMAVGSVSGVTFADMLSAEAWSGTSEIRLLKITSGSNAGFLTDSDLTTTPNITVSGVYEIA